jgi:hypothetical protein
MLIKDGSNRLELGAFSLAFLRLFHEGRPVLAGHLNYRHGPQRGST